MPSPGSHCCGTNSAPGSRFYPAPPSLPGGWLDEVGGSFTTCCPSPPKTHPHPINPNSHHLFQSPSTATAPRPRGRGRRGSGGTTTTLSPPRRAPSSQRTQVRAGVGGHQEQLPHTPVGTNHLGKDYGKTLGLFWGCWGAPSHPRNKLHPSSPLSSSPGRCLQSFQPPGQLLRQRLRPAFCPQSVTPAWPDPPRGCLAAPPGRPEPSSPRPARSPGARAVLERREVRHGGARKVLPDPNPSVIPPMVPSCPRTPPVSLPA